LHSIPLVELAALWQAYIVALIQSTGTRLTSRLVSNLTPPAWKRETKLETKPFPTGGMAGLLANHTAKGNGLETTAGNEGALSRGRFVGARFQKRPCQPAVLRV